MKPTIIAFRHHTEKLVPSFNGSWDLYRRLAGEWRFHDNVGQDTFDRIVDEADDLAELIDQTAAPMTESPLQQLADQAQELKMGYESADEATESKGDE